MSRSEQLITLSVVIDAGKLVVVEVLELNLHCVTFRAQKVEFSVGSVGTSCSADLRVRVTDVMFRIVKTSMDMQVRMNYLVDVDLTIVSLIIFIFQGSPHPWIGLLSESSPPESCSCQGPDSSNVIV